jgi:hypothetical protein
MSGKKAVKKTAKKAAKKAATKMTGYKGLHRAGSIKSKLHELFDKFGPEKAKSAALKIAAPGTVSTSFSQFRNAKKA